MLDVYQVMQILGISKQHAYKMIRELNHELESKGYRTIRGKVPRLYLLERYALLEEDLDKEVSYEAI